MPIRLPGTGPDVEPRKARKWRIFWSYLPDWVLTIFLWGILYLVDKIDGYRRLFDVTDTSLAHPHADPDRIPVWLLAIVCGLIPGLAMILIGAIYQRSFWDAHSALLGFILNLGLTITITNILKASEQGYATPTGANRQITIGRPRPDLFDRCQLPPDLTENPVHGLTSWTVCTRTTMLKDGFRSFPSGHSSFAWAGMWFFILYLCAKMRISNRRGYTWKAWLLLAPLLCAMLVGVSRLMDYRHHATDVIGGGIIGILAAWFSYRQYYPPIAAPQSYKPYSPRIPSSAETLPLHSTAAGPGALSHGSGGGSKTADGRPSSERLTPESYEMHNGRGHGAVAGSGALSGEDQGHAQGQAYEDVRVGSEEQKTVQRPGRYE